ncbi:MAG: hypothetical protein HCA25_00485 (plasmid) [Dolichospermum sp. DET50]|nr:hypothetical protein [Dolichospermum sp. DET66]MBS3035979.1 hypothetical protein [Dolichospermum sp. DET67]MBS3041147.1 hypothetical protein [Dolichospermum sp. DET50]QSX70889.1 MAG: hypothetical protein EZY12_27210 [Dolichospermum sp. DET69]
MTKRKVSGSILTVIQTCRRQGRSVIEFFDQAIKAMVNPNPVLSDWKNSIPERFTGLWF